MKDEEHNKIIKNFVKFLKYNDAYGKYRRYCYRNSTLFGDDAFRPINCDDDLILLAFFWADTNEGTDFWVNLDKKWRGTLNGYEKTND